MRLVPLGLEFNLSVSPATAFFVGDKAFLLSVRPTLS